MVYHGVTRGRARTDLTLFVLYPPQLLEALAQLREDQQVRVLLFKSAVKGVFCAGGSPVTLSSLGTWMP